MNAPLLKAEAALFPAVSFNVEAGKFEGVTAHMVDSWADAYPGLNIDQELTRAACWLICNPSKRPGGDLLHFLHASMGRMARLPVTEA
jgi:hypothetical protein